MNMETEIEKVIKRNSWLRLKNKGKKLMDVSDYSSPLFSLLPLVLGLFLHFFL